VSVFRLIEGLITIARPGKPVGYASFEDDYAPAVNQLFDFGGVRKDVYIFVTAPTTIIFDSLANEPVSINAYGPVLLTDQWSSKAYVTFTNSPVTHMIMYANG